ncbi:ATP-binding protein [Uliginosibacterium sediminicola]|uniref:histidine kinase n=1 Tax=Uliginosibacterium sediminicola TaxID=2024550 RepID=A0ABU9YWI3_9RHOO
MHRPRTVLLTTCCVAPLLASGLAVLLPLPPLIALPLGALAGSLLLWPALRALQAQAAHSFCERVLDEIPYPVAIKDADSRLLLVNRAMLDYKNLSRDALIGSLGRCPAESEDFHRQRLAEDQQVLAGRPVRKEERLPPSFSHNGREISQIVVKRRTQSLQGQPLVVCSLFDISEQRLSQRRAEEALAREVLTREHIADFTQRLIDVIPQPVYIKDAHSRYLLVNAAFCRYRMLSAGELIGKSPFDLAKDPAHAAMVVAEDATVLAGGSVSKEEESRHPVTGESIFRWLGKERCQDADGRPIIVGVNFDLTPWRLAERENQQALAREKTLRERVQAFMQRLIDVIPQPVYVKNAASCYIMANKAMLEDMCKSSPAELLDKTPSELGWSADYAAHIVAEDQRIALGEIVYKEEHITHPSSGKAVHRIISKRSCLDAEGRAVIVGANFDITPLREAERSAARASEAKSLFLATMSHEIRTPLNGVIGMLRLALKRPLDKATREQLGVSLRSAESLLTIINDILDFSKIEAGHLQLEEIDFELRQTIADALQSFRLSAQERSIALVVDIDERLPRYVRGDPTRLRQVLINLTGNSLKFTRRGSITVRLREHPAGLQVEVEDTGIGIAAEALPRIFQRFQQADSSTTRVFGGTGLGLAICKQLVEAMGGEITVRSTEGVGSVFSFSIALKAGTAPTESADASEQQALRSLSILCAEDSPTNQIIIEALLDALGHRVSMASDGLEALEQLAAHDFDLVLMDGRMPKLDGHATTRAIRAGEYAGLRIRNPQIKLVALTANVSEIDMTEFRAAGADEFLAKPIDEQQLARLLARLSRQIPPAPTAPAASPAAKPALNERIRAKVIASLPARIAEVEQALAAADLETLTRLFHGFKGNIGFAGDPALTAQAATLEAQAASAQGEALARDWPAFRAALQALQTVRPD